MVTSSIYLEDEDKALKKLGFDFEGCMRECEIKNDKFIDVGIYLILNNKNS